MLLNKLNHGKQKAKEREQRRSNMLKEKNHGLGIDPEEKQKTSIRYTVRVVPFVKSL